MGTGRLRAAVVEVDSRHGRVRLIVFLAVILKIPVFFGIWLIWWAVKEEPELEDLPGDAGDHSFRRFRRNPTKPGGPRKRGPTAAPRRPSSTARPAGASERRWFSPGWRRGWPRTSAASTRRPVAD